LLDSFDSILWDNRSLQGALVFPLNNDDAKWFWVNWDMDHSFMDLYSKAENPWEIDIFEILLRRDVRRPRPRQVIFERLRKESPEFLEYFRQFFADTLNYKLTSQFLESRVTYYDELSKAFGIESRGFLDDLRQYIKNRHAVLRKQFQRYFDTKPMLRLRINSTKASRFLINGHSIPTGFEGWYFEGTTIKIKIPKDYQSGFDNWIINGKVKTSPPELLEIKLLKNVDIEAAF
jgi:hypothetical protein